MLKQVLLCNVLVLVLLNCSARAVDLAEHVDLDLVNQVCADKKAPIRTMDQMKKIIWATRMDPKLCHRDFQASLNELDAILAVDTQDLCSERMIDLIKQYHFRFILPLRRVNRRPKHREGELWAIRKRQLHPEPYKYTIYLDEHDQPLKIPLALRHFFLSFALQLSGTCKKAMVANLYSNLVVDKLRHDDRSVLALLNSESPLNDLLVHDLKSVNFDNVLYLPELEGISQLLEKTDLAAAGKQVHLQTSATKNAGLFDMMLDCRNHLRPIYDKLMMPIIKLSKLGYDYSGEKLSADEQAKLNGPETKSWLGVVHVCEMFHNILLIERDDKKLIDEDEEIEYDDDGQIIRPMTDDEIAELDGAKKVTLPDPIEYQPSVAVPELGKELWIVSEKQLDHELSLKAGNSHPFGWKGYLRRTGARLKRAAAKLDFQRFAHYRTHSEFYSGFLNAISSCSNVASITVTIVFTVAPFV